jgi:hypothetical protein
MHIAQVERLKRLIIVEVDRLFTLVIRQAPGSEGRRARRGLALCLTWRQSAANHHELSIVSV